ncbi:hypothetical protein NE237_018977 [Protea cynaroides]|uniref:Uncharacterized protein n=1 Tax=Protea cynaroides TaxID=273540 RepID=A0A9Q0KAV5_9MAGN|nr:hypothetical protein NE237_018977 [Protea cynaroides]
MGSALETLCGQAFGAKQVHMLGIYMQRSWVILTLAAFILFPIYLFASPILKFFGQDDEIAELAGTFSLYMTPQLFALAINFPMQKFLQAQSKVMAVAWMSGLALVFDIFLCWLLMVQFNLLMMGAAIALNLYWWILVLGQFVYIVMGYCPSAWTGFSWGAFRDLGAFARLAIASAIMLGLEVWSYMLLVVLAGSLKDAQIAVAASSICNNLNGWELMILIGFNAAICVRISNELGSGRPRAAKFSIVVVVLTSALIGVAFQTTILLLRNVYALPFTNSPEVARAVSHHAVLFSFTLLLNSVQPVLTGLPLGFLLGAQLDLGVEAEMLEMLGSFKLSLVMSYGSIDPSQCEMDLCGRSRSFYRLTDLVLNGREYGQG